MFLTPDGEPFWGGTYFPPEPHFGRPGFVQVLQRIAEVYAQDPDGVGQNVATLKEALGKLARNKSADAIPPETIDQVAERLVREIDPFEGGIGEAPKFPQPAMFKLLWRAWLRTKAEPYRHAVELTLNKMCQGGIYDHLGGGFARYAVDHRWLVPHFEKMLYDNAQMLDLLTWAWQGAGNPLFEARARETTGWVLREMIADGDGSGAQPTGAFASSLDADSEGEEGKFYVWSAAEIDTVLGDDAAFFKDAYDVTPGGNWEGKTILNRSRKPELGDDEYETKLAGLRAKLFKARAVRPRPTWDDKVLADWNGLMIAALARAAPVFGEPAWLAAAERAFAFIVERMIEDRRLKHAWRHGQLKHPANLDDYANMAEAALELFEATGDGAYIARAEDWTETLDRHYWDGDAGGYFLTADDTEQLVVRAKSAHDHALPAGNGTMVGVLARLFLSDRQKRVPGQGARAYRGVLGRAIGQRLRAGGLPQQRGVPGARGANRHHRRTQCARHASPPLGRERRVPAGPGVADDRTERGPARGAPRARQGPSRRQGHGLCVPWADLFPAAHRSGGAGRRAGRLRPPLTPTP